ncbi:hypothetical protein BO71DRAFT_488077 [Aspergillus ellipticus CBS 707.79]|uniref:Zn(2)-C6 fungal-type domain-containing protein n=1 Tax=Aspergillus ellipticus CBS 707.79 TaxID=1448320 RepID=A0A319CW10_9EURO|nr:hypothetical protein BO71DRAFT_488077 [Aspergillus ellipticus CBS 707.79]
MESQSQSVSQPGKHRRRRPSALSCRECRRRKIKCDHNAPCAQCMRHRTRCIYKAIATSPPPSQPSSPSTSTQDGPPGHQTFRSEVQTPPVTEAAQGISTQPPLRTPGPAGEPTLHDGHHLVLNPEKSSLNTSRITDSPTLNVPSETGESSSAGAQEWQAVLNKDRDWGRSRWMGRANEFTTIIACYGEILGKGSKDGSCHDPEATDLIAQAAGLLQRCKTRAKSIKLGRPTRGLSSPGFGLVPYSREMADAMVDLYLTSFESTHRILHIPTFRSEYRQYWENPQAATPSLRLQVLLVTGIGSSLYDHGDSAAVLRNIDVVQQWIYAAQTWLSGPLEKDRLDISGVQIFCLTILARQIFSIGADTIWISIGSLAHSAMQIGLNRDPKHLPTHSILEAELRAHVETQRQDGTLHRTRQYREFLKQAVRDQVILSEERIRLGETNPKSHMCLSMVLGQVEAVEGGGGLEVGGCEGGEG